jgi:hypothetical protein
MFKGFTGLMTLQDSRCRDSAGLDDWSSKRDTGINHDKLRLIHMAEPSERKEAIRNALFIMLDAL